MGLFDKLFGKAESTAAIKTEPDTLYLPIKGKVIPLKEIGDGVFSEEILGKGCGIVPSEETVYAPADGTVSQVAETKHALGMMTDDGLEVLIHVGMDTVEMKRNGFQILVKPDQKVKCGQPVMKFSMDKIKAAGHPTTTAFLVTNSDDFSDVEVLQSGMNEKLAAVIKVKR